MSLRKIVAAGLLALPALALAITKAHGVEGAQLLEAFTNNANCSPLITMKLPSMMAASYDPHFSLKNMLKDARYAQALAREKEIKAPVLDASAAVMERAERAGRGELDYGVVFENFSTPKEAPAAPSEEKPRKRAKSKADKSVTRITLKAQPLEDADAGVNP